MVRYYHDLTPASSQVPKSCSLSLPQWGGLGNRIIRKLGRKLMCWETDNLIGSTKAVHASKAAGPHHSQWLCGRQILSLQTSPLSSFLSQLICWAWSHMVWNIPFDCPVPAVSPPNHPCTPNFIASVATWKAERPWLSVSPTHNNKKHLYIVNPVFGTSSKHSPI